MHLGYNGVPLEILTLDRVERRTVLTPDQTSVLYTEWGISLSCVYHPQLGSVGGTSIGYVNAGDKNMFRPAPTPMGNAPVWAALNYPGPEYPIQTDKELHVRLSAPRKPLIIWAYDKDGTTPVVWLRSPRIGPDGVNPLPRDAFIGPIVQANVVTATLGSGVSFGVQMEIKTWLPPCPDGSDRLILAHRWQQGHGHDENYYLTRTTVGEIWFNGGVKDQFSLRSDVIARQLFHPIPLGFRRYLGPVTQSPDGLVVRYTFDDVDQKVVFDPGASGATTIAISENVNYRVPFQGLQELFAALAKGTVGVVPGTGIAKRILPNMIAGIGLLSDSGE